MKNILFILLSSLFFHAFAQNDLANLVNPFIGTGGHGHTYPGASRPFGMMQLSPDTRLTGWDGCSGYHYSDSILYGFSHTHLSGTGVSDYGDVLIMPFDPANCKKDKNGQLISGFKHSNEKASPGYYAVHLDDGNIDAELTVNNHSGLHHYTYNDGGTALVIDLNHRDELIAYEIAPVNARTLVGKRISKAWAQEQHLYFVIEFSQDFSIQKTELNGKRMYLNFNQSNELYVKIGISAVDIEGAKKNLSQEIPDWNFEELKKDAHNVWNKELNKINIFSADANFLSIYYTALYHSFLNPNLFSDVDFRYRGMDNQIHQSDGPQYTVFSLWDTFRALHPLFTLIQQKRSEDFIRTFLRQYKDGGALPVWELAANETNCMIGYHAVSVIADAYSKGINDFDTQLALKAMLSIAQKDELGKKEFHSLGFIPMESEHESVSKTLEYAYDDWCIAQYAKLIGKDSIAEQYFGYAQNYKNMLNPKNGFMQAKLHNEFVKPFDPKEVNFNYTEANAWQYSFFVPQDIQNWIGLMGGDSIVESKLDELFSENSQTTGRQQVDITGLIGQYAHGNEPSHHIAFLYNYLGNPTKTQEKTNEIIQKMYQNTPDGLSGNEDCGQMSAWLNMSALGLYAVTPGLPIYTFTVPYVDSAYLNLENGNTTKIICHNRQANAKNYIQKVKINGVDWDNSYINHKIIETGCQLEFFLGNSPSNWAKNSLNRPFSAIHSSLISIDPYFETTQVSFEDSTKVSIKNTSPHQLIYYTLDGSTPTQQSPLYAQAITLNKTTTIKAIAFLNDKSSPIIEKTFVKKSNDWQVELNCKVNPQYTAGGPEALIDQQYGGQDFRTGAWMGVQEGNFVVKVDLKKSTLIHEVGGNFIQDIRSWIWMPTKLSVWSSDDGVHWQKIADINNTISSKDYTVRLQKLSIQLSQAISTKFLKFEAFQFGTIPEWHLGNGGESFIFSDELIIR